MNEADDASVHPPGKGATPYDVIKWRLYSGEFEAVAKEALRGELDFGVEHTDAWELVGRAIEHDLGMRFHGSDDLMEIATEHDRGELTIKIVWPSDEIVNQVRLEIAADQVKLDPYFLSRAEIRNADPEGADQGSTEANTGSTEANTGSTEATTGSTEATTGSTEATTGSAAVDAKTGVRRSLQGSRQGSKLVAQSNIALRPITDANRVVVAAIPGHRYDFGKLGRFDWGPWCPAPSTMERQADIYIDSSLEPVSGPGGNYAVAREGTRVYELVDKDEAYRQRREKQREERREQQRDELWTVAYSLGIVAAGSIIVCVAATRVGPWSLVCL